MHEPLLGRHYNTIIVVYGYDGAVLVADGVHTYLLYNINRGVKVKVLQNTYSKMCVGFG